MEQRRRIVVFGIFDGVHDGHRDLFRQARGLGGELVVIVGRDSAAEQLKGKRPKLAEEERVAMLKREEGIHDAVLGDRELSTYKVLESLNPDVICLGYDQHDLAQDLQKWAEDRNISIYRAKPYAGGALHNSLIS